MSVIDEDRTAADRLPEVGGVMFDIDGCLILSDGGAAHAGIALPGAAAAIEYVRAQGLPLVVFTNGSMQAPWAIAESLRTMGIEVADEEVLTPAVVAADIAAERYPDAPVLLFGGPGVAEVFRRRGVALVDFSEALAHGPVQTPLVVIGWDVEFSRDKLLVAAEAVSAGARILVTSDSPTFASQRRLNVGVSGFIAAGLRHVTGEDYEIAGKPSATAMTTIAAHLGVDPSRVLVIGDDLALEAAMAVQAGALAALVTTGTSSREDVRAAPLTRRPHLVVDSLTELTDLWSSAIGARR